ncbi:MAPEG family protein [Maritalea sp.]|uniref:MAPEG family protein n=1 Tax=Maritalea sp. TaxID=2003361 RepID=UPI0039E2158E
MTFTAALIAFAILTMILLSNQIFFTYATQGFGYGFSSNRKGNIELSPLAVRIANTYRNQVEASAYLVPVLAVAALIGLQSESAQFAALLIIVGRVLFSVLYYIGWPFARVPAFGLANLSALYLVYEIIVSGVL